MRWPSRFGSLVVTIALIGIGQGAAASVSSSAASIASSPLATGSVDWQPVNGLLGGSLPGFTVDAGDAVVWPRGFAVLEGSAHVGDGRSNADLWLQPAVWLSDDGRAWTRHPLPRTIAPDGLTLLTTWHDGLLVVDQRARERGWRFLLWASTDGRRWNHIGTFDPRPVGALRDCAFTETQIVSTKARILAMASCTGYGSGGDIGPGGVALAAHEVTHAPLWSWTSDDGRRWRQHLVTEELDPKGAARYPVMLRAIGTGFAAVMCCYPPSIWWSDDGAHWDDVIDLPAGISYDDVEDLDAVDEDGHPATWLLMADRQNHDESLTGSRVTLWTGDGNAWTEVIGQADWQGSVLATDGQVAVVAVTKVMTLEPNVRMRLDTITSVDGAGTWTLSEGDDTDIACCIGSVALRDGAAVLTGLAGADSVSVRRADIRAGVPAL